MALYNTGSNWDVVNGDNAQVVLSNAWAEIIGGGESIFSEGPGNISALYNTNNVFDDLTGSKIQ